MKIPFNKTKIVATIGPGSANLEMLTKLAKAGVNVFRLNFSHGSHEDHLEVFKYIQEINKGLEHKVSVLADLQGPKIRLGLLKDGEFDIKSGETIKISTKPVELSPECLYINYETLAREVNPRDRILIDDGKIELSVTSTNGIDEIYADIIYGGTIKSRKGVNLPDTKLSVPSLTEKDINDLEFILKHPFDWIALSFVRKAKDVTQLRDIIQKNEHKGRIISKIEKPEALTNIKKIIRESDGIMVARGDLGVEVPGERVPLIQKDLVRRCIKATKPVIIATQMMESMIENPKPTRAEINDVANAVLDGADAVMLSGETAVGKYPVEVINTIKKILTTAESTSAIYNKKHTAEGDSDSFLSDAICYNAARLAGEVKAHGIIGMTVSGYTAFKTSSLRPKADIFIFTENKNILNTLSLVWGVRAFYYDKFESTDDTINDVKNILKEKGILRKGDIVVNLGSMPLKERGRTNMLRVSRMS